MDPDRAFSQYIRDRWEKSSGFVAGPVYGITQTRDGYLWIAAEKGVVRFDGLRFRLFEPLQPTATTDTAALNVVPDPEGGLWTWLRRAALMRLRNGAFENALNSAGPPEPRVGAMATGNDGAILIADTRHGLLVWRAGQRRDRARARGAAPAVRHGDRADAGRRHLARDAQCRARPRAAMAAPHRSRGVPLTQIKCLVPDGRNGLWIGTDDGIFRWDGGSVTRAATTPEAGRARALAMVKRSRRQRVGWPPPTGLVRIDSHGAAVVRTARVVVGRDGAVRGSRRQPVDRRHERHRAVARRRLRVVHERRSASWPVASDRCSATPRDRVWFAPASGGLYWLRDGRVGAVASPARRCDLLDRRRRRCRPGRQAARRDDAGARAR